MHALAAVTADGGGVASCRTAAWVGASGGAKGTLKRSCCCQVGAKVEGVMQLSGWKTWSRGHACSGESPVSGFLGDRGGLSNSFLLPKEDKKENEKKNKEKTIKNKSQAKTKKQFSIRETKRAKRDFSITK